MAGLFKRGKKYYALYYVGGSKKRVSLGTQSLQVAKEKIRQLESAQLRGDANPLPTKTPLAEIVEKYVKHVRSMKTEKSAQTDVYYLRSMFGTICPGLEITSRKTSLRAKKRPPRKCNDRRFKDRVIEASYLEQITTADISGFIAHQVQSRSLAPKTANRYREIMSRLFNWAMDEAGVKMPGDNNPASKVSKYKEHAPVIRFLNLEQIDSQLISLNDNTQLQTMVAMLIYAGIRREELLWITLDDIARIEVIMV
ncbi:MAG: site-specific integrase [Nitrospinales bacterium]